MITAPRPGRARLRSSTTSLCVLVVGALLLPPPEVVRAEPEPDRTVAVDRLSPADRLPAADPDTEVAWFEPGMDAAAALARAERASEEVPHRGTLAVVALGETGPRLSSVDVRRAAGGIELVDEDGRRLGRTAGEAFLRGTDRLLRVGGVERLSGALGVLERKYRGTLGDPVELETGPAVPLELVERATGTVRELVYLDAATALIVRRETYDRTGAPVRLAAFTSLEVGDTEVAMPDRDGRTLLEVEVAAGDADELRALGFVVPDALPAGYDLLAVWSSRHDDDSQQVHAVYGDGLYTVSVFQQRGRLAPAAVDDAVRLRTSDGGAVWRWPGSEPRQLVWQGGDLIFTALTDAPTDEALEVLAGLPADPPPSILTRLQRGLDRMGTWLGGGRSPAAP